MYAQEVYTNDINVEIIETPSFCGSKWSFGPSPVAHPISYCIPPYLHVDSLKIPSVTKIYAELERRRLKLT